MSEQTGELVKRIRATGKFCFVYTPSPEDKQVPESHFKARIKINFEKCLSAYFGESEGEPIAKYNNEPQRY